MTYEAARIVFTIAPAEEVEPQILTGLFDQYAGQNLFYHPALLRAAVALPPALQPTDYILGYQRGQLRLAQPILLSRTSAGRRLEFFQFWGADHLEPLYDKAYEEETLAAFTHFLLEGIPGIELVLGENLSRRFANKLQAAAGGCRKARYRVEPQYECPYLELPGSVEAFWKMYRSNFRSQLKKKIRKAEAYGLEFRVVRAECMPEGYSLEQAFDQLVALHDMRSDETGRRSRFTGEDRQRFHRQLCRDQRPADGFVTFTEALDQGKVVGSLYGFKAAQRYAFFQTGFDVAYGKLGIGNLLLFYTVEDLIRNGVPLFDFKRGLSDYKMRWTQSIEPTYRLYLSPGLRGRLPLQRLLWRREMKKQGRLQGTLHWVRQLGRPTVRTSKPSAKKITETAPSP